MLTRLLDIIYIYIYIHIYIYIYIDDLIAQLKQSGHGIYIEQLFVGCVCYADDIALQPLLSASCYGLQKLVDICRSYNISWDIKYNPLKSRLLLVDVILLSV